MVTCIDRFEALALDLMSDSSLATVEGPCWCRAGWHFAVVPAAVIVMLMVAMGCTSGEAPGMAEPADDQASVPGFDEASTVGEVAAPVDQATSEPPSTVTDVDDTSTTTAIATEASSATETGRGPMINQAEPELRFDYGEIVRYERVQGVGWIWFDRHSFGELQGPELGEEPRWEMATDWHGGGNVNPSLRAYPLAPEARTLEIDPADFKVACADLSLPWDFVDSDVPTLLAHDWHLASLTFDEDHRVVLIRDQRGC